jgi:hypothetical protein
MRSRHGTRTGRPDWSLGTPMNNGFNHRFQSEGISPVSTTYLATSRNLTLRCSPIHQRRHGASTEQEPGDDGPDHQEDGGTFECDVVAVDRRLRLQRGN